MRRKPDLTAPGSSRRRSFALPLVAIPQPNIVTIRLKASPVVSASCTSAILM